MSGTDFQLLADAGGAYHQARGTNVNRSWVTGPPPRNMRPPASRLDMTVGAGTAIGADQRRGAARPIAPDP
jgi:hypothetical protein